ncbi:unnamed protein product, partial [Ceratitis capitata]
GALGFSGRRGFRGPPSFGRPPFDKSLNYPPFAKRPLGPLPIDRPSLGYRHLLYRYLPAPSTDAPATAAPTVVPSSVAPSTVAPAAQSSVAPALKLHQQRLRHHLLQQVPPHQPWFRQQLLQATAFPEAPSSVLQRLLHHQPWFRQQLLQQLKLHQQLPQRLRHQMPQQLKLHQQLPQRLRHQMPQQLKLHQQLPSGSVIRCSSN